MLLVDLFFLPNIAPAIPTARRINISLGSKELKGSVINLFPLISI